jgi:hypothetical protein
VERFAERDIESGRDQRELAVGRAPSRLAGSRAGGVTHAPLMRTNPSRMNESNVLFTKARLRGARDETKLPGHLTFHLLRHAAASG